MHELHALRELSWVTHFGMSWSDSCSPVEWTEWKREKWPVAAAADAAAVDAAAAVAVAAAAAAAAAAGPVVAHLSCKSSCRSQ